MSPFKKLISRCRAGLPGNGRFRRDQSGAAAVDFAMVLLPFLAVLMAIIESAVVLLAGQVLQTAATDSARMILTGQAQNGNWGLTQFQNNVCASLTVMFNCASNLHIDVRSFSSFSAVSLPSADNCNGTANNYTYQPGNPGDIVVVRLIYRWPIFASALGIGLVNCGGNTNALVASAAFRNEPYAVAGP